jgi:hypothetical protein
MINFQYQVSNHEIEGLEAAARKGQDDKLS